MNAPIVLVEWRDMYIVHTVGFLISRNEEEITIAAERDKGAYHDEVDIPTKDIISITTLVPEQPSWDGEYRIYPSTSTTNDGCVPVVPW